MAALLSTAVTSHKSPSAQPRAGGAKCKAPPSQPLAAGLQEDKGEDETDHEGLDVRPCLGEQEADVQEQEWLQLEDLARSDQEWCLEAEELAFKNKVSAVTW